MFGCRSPWLPHSSPGPGRRPAAVRSSWETKMDQSSLDLIEIILNIFKLSDNR